MKKLITIFLVLLGVSNSFAQELTPLESGFKNPPQESRPKTWMHALNGNMSKAGLTKDLEAIADVGVGGVLLFNIAYGIPNGDVRYNSQKHRDLLSFAAEECERLGLSFGVHNCDGWSASGGPWIAPEQSMKMVVHSETIVNGGRQQDIQLSKPTTREDYYKDIAVLAYPSFPSEISDAENIPTITSTDENTNISVLTDGKQDEITVLSGSKDKPAGLVFEYKMPFNLRSLLIPTKNRRPEVTVFISDDGIHYTQIETPRVIRPGKMEFTLSKSYAGHETRFIKIETTTKLNLFEVGLYSTQLINEHLGLVSMTKVSASKIPAIGNPSPDMIIDKSKIINLTSQMDSLGILHAKLPKGHWTVMRFGFTSTAAFNHPASDSGRGLEVDKFSKEAVKIHYDAFTKKVAQESMPKAPNAMQYVEIDSYEMGGQNWTHHYLELFEEKYNYNLISFLPMYAGRFVESPASCLAVSYDIRKQNSDLMVENYFGYFTELSHKDGIKTYIEPYGNGPMDNLATGGKSDIPMGEFWTTQPTNITSDAVGAARIYGKNIISAEAFTANAETNWRGHPATNKSKGDFIWTEGINEFMFHRFAHQANTEVAPGMTMGPWGSHFDRTNTWWDNAGKSWFKYMSRGQYLLRQGVPVVDILVLPGDASPNPSFDPHLPEYVTTNMVNSDVLIHRISVKNGKLVLPEGLEYKALILGNIERIELPTLRRLYELSADGATIIGAKPLKIAQYKVTKAEEDEFEKLVEFIWSKSTTYENMDWSIILPKLNITPDFSVEGQKHVNYIHRKTANADIYFFHNESDKATVFKCSFNVTGKIPELWNAMTGQITQLAYFVQNQGKTEVQIPLEALESTFVVFKEPVKDNITVNTSSHDSFAINYSYNEGHLVAEVKENATYKIQLSNGKTWEEHVKNIPDAMKIDGAWNVQFRKKDGYDKTLVFPELSDWKNHDIDAIKYYSGTAVYTKTFKLTKKQLKDDFKHYLDLGKVSIAAKVILNGKDLGVLWIAPFQVDITEAVKVGINELSIEVTNLWTNRLIGDEGLPDTSGYDKKAKEMPKWYTNNQPQPEGKRRTFTVFNFYERDNTKVLESSGLLGPVSISTSKIIKRK